MSKRVGDHVEAEAESSSPSHRRYSPSPLPSTSSKSSSSGSPRPPRSPPPEHLVLSTVLEMLQHVFCRSQTVLEDLGENINPSLEETAAHYAAAFGHVADVLKCLGKAKRSSGSGGGQGGGRGVGH